MQVSSLDRMVRRSVIHVLQAALVLLVLCAGCAGPAPRAEIPFGEWSGQGTFVYERWQSADTAAEDEPARSIHRCYPTSLSIRPGQLDGREVVELEIRSDRGPLPELDDRTHIKAALLKAKRVSDRAVLYRVVGFLINPKQGETLRFLDDAPPVSASCTTTDGATVLQIHYADDFVDAISFRGGHVEKSGTYFTTDEGLIHWSETLSPQK
ncbi:MAG: hypothetical protein JSV19_01090 [Phycisphaerales bacterium]|nr:MAG: hypothetical protein JSV19_01090 [Phycisphaerales bacterium]